MTLGSKLVLRTTVLASLVLFAALAFRARPAAAEPTCAVTTYADGSWCLVCYQYDSTAGAFLRDQWCGPPPAPPGAGFGGGERSTGPEHEDED